MFKRFLLTLVILALVVTGLSAGERGRRGFYRGGFYGRPFFGSSFYRPFYGNGFYGRSLVYGPSAFFPASFYLSYALPSLPFTGFYAGFYYGATLPGICPAGYTWVPAPVVVNGATVQRFQLTPSVPGAVAPGAVPVPSGPMPNATP
jgi:hypothetical protein